jgi:hypothetical protein
VQSSCDARHVGADREAPRLPKRYDSTPAMPVHPPRRRPHHRLPAATLASAVFAAHASAQQPPPPTPPATWPLRQHEDWRHFRAGGSDCPLDRLKHIELDDDGDVWLSFGGRADARFEAWDGIGFGARTPGNSDTFSLTRITLHADVHLGEHVRAFVEGRTAQPPNANCPAAGARPTSTRSTCSRASSSSRPHATAAPRCGCAPGGSRSCSATSGW